MASLRTTAHFKMCELPANVNETGEETRHLPRPESDMMLTKNGRSHDNGVVQRKAGFRREKPLTADLDPTVMSPAVESALGLLSS